MSSKVTESVYSTCDDYDEAVRRVRTLNWEASESGKAETFGVVPTRECALPVRTVDRYVILVRRAEP